ncbi:hypothetical protein [Ichthyenterobacterium magnum]|uniref:Uncharacterized protein n=1 Tax=Ichthyenterobacterium magnum TaxID=1230530 RepID=A0A420DFS8_9FLAO|nr:hypothetical protein [Ichthyenterobacterium magnum]RKE91934.1 hypothetical protein BXY80_2363 [Ichthyenterobacterium magnum]
MKSIQLLLLFVSVTLFSQENIETTFIKKTELKAQSIVDIDNFGTIYYLNKNTLYKKSDTKTLSYSNIQLNTITSANAFNPLKVNLFYKDFNTIIILDNRLAEIFKVDFNTSPLYKNVSHTSTGYDNTLWVFNQDNQQLELYDYKANKTRVSALPIQSNVIDLKSDYNYCWVLTKDYLYQYNYFGSLISKLKNNSFTSMVLNNGNLVLKAENTLSYLSKNTQEIIPIKTPKLLINQFLLTNESLYIYDNEILQEFQLKTN